MQNDYTPHASTRCCPTCGKPLVQRSGEKPVHFKQRIHCNHSCQVRARHGLQPDPWKVCAVCGSFFGQREGEMRWSYRERKTCSRACQYTSNGITQRKPDGNRQCVICGAQLRRKPKEKTDAFAARQTCNRDCGAKKARLTHYKVTQRQSPYPIEWCPELRDAIRERDHHCCRVCGLLPGKRAHHVHHIDYVKGNLSPDNLITLCPSCHSETNGNRAYWQARLTALMQGVM